MTATDTTTRWSHANPFAHRRAHELAAAGGKHRPSDVSTDRVIMEEESIVEWARESRDLHDHPAEASDCW